VGALVLNGYTIRYRMRYDDDRIIEIARSFYGDDVWTADELIDLLKKRSISCRVAERPDGCVVGYIIWVIAKDRFEIISLVTDEHYRRKRVASALLVGLQKTCNSARPTILVQIYEDDEGPLRLLVKNGFRVEKVVHSSPQKALYRERDFLLMAWHR